jgi:hypothetical protein
VVLVDRPPLTPESLRRAVEALRAEKSGVENAVARAERLLHAWLTAEQQACHAQFGYFHVVGSASGKTYRIWRDTTFNIHELDGHGNTVHKWCFVPLGCIALGDVILAQKIALETSERRALRIANRQPPRPRDIVRAIAQITIGATRSLFRTRLRRRMPSPSGERRGIVPS